ncbi:YbaN family protein [Maritimibacter sp. DP1N21-5]|uniref:YbaN family protein n=1 Tax=Maritimibacter sp. DP1N21-5 TaxID=2836867 RepID=UPI001C448C85|nr:YbaN family protein [Maritimibacter sp. DP1N21-5]MBV7410258.1 YbaN family protein [Maritimibacter sp. DP1N21-5]
MARFGWLVLGWGAVALGLIGVVLPGLPTTVFLILAAFAFGRSSPRARAWLIGHRAFGPAILDWEDRGAIAPRAKRLAVLTMIAVFVLSLVFGAPSWVLVLQAVCLTGAAAFVITRPE